MTYQIELDYSNTQPFFQTQDLFLYQNEVMQIHKQLHEKTNKNSDLSWIDYPVQYNKEELRRILEVAEKIKSNADALIVVGMDSSYLGARAAIDMLHHYFYNSLPKEKRETPQIFFVGNNVSSTYMVDLLSVLKDKDIVVNIISQSRATTESVIAFRMIRRFLEEKYGVEEARKRMYVTTAKEKGVLKTLASQEGYETFVIPDEIDGKYSVFTAAGLLPMAVSGIAINEVLAGAAKAREDLYSPNLMKNPAYQYAVIRNILYSKGKAIEIFATYQPSMTSLVEWWKQLFGEREGKGIFPASASYLTDLHSFGQLIQDGERNLFETVLQIEQVRNDQLIHLEEKDLDNLNYLAGKSIDFVNKHASVGAMIAHIDGGVPNLLIRMPEHSAHTFGYLVYFFMKACIMNEHLLSRNLFDQNRKWDIG